MKSEYTLSDIKKFWENRSETHGENPTASCADSMMIKMEVEALAAHITDDSRVLDIGCANGHTAFALASRVNAKIHGIDYISGMIENANAKLKNIRELNHRISFSQDDILEGLSEHNDYDIAYLVRVLINLGSTENQANAIRAACNCVKKGGTILISDATQDGLENLNKARAEWGLSEIPVKPFNLYITENLIRDSLPDNCELLSVDAYSSTYFFGTRVIKPLLASVCDTAPEITDTKSEWNRFFSELPVAGNYGIQKLFIISRKY